MSQETEIPGELDLEEFRRYGHEIVDWIVDYLGHPEKYPVLSRVEPGEIKAQLPAAPPQQAQNFDTIFADFENILLPGITHWNHPSFFAYFSITGSWPGILGELLTAALNVNGMLWRTSPAVTELEQVTLDWLRQMLGLPADFRGVITDTASISSLVAIAAAREALDRDVRRKGLAGRAELPRLRMYTSEQSHSSIEKAGIVIGIGQEGVRKIPTDDAFRMRPDALQKAIEEDIAAGWQPFCAVATVGTTSTTSIDPVPEIARICQQYGLWLHVDGAYGGTAAIVPEMRYVLDGAEHANSIVVNPHKWLFTPIDCSVLYVRDPDILQRAFSLVPEYLKGREDVTNYMDWGIQLGRRFRALKLWMVIRSYGVEGLIARLRAHIALAQKLVQWVDDDPDFERLAPAPFSTVCFRALPHDLGERLHTAGPDEVSKIESYLDALNQVVIDAVNATGTAFLSHTKLHNHFTIRIAIGNIRTEESHVSAAWNLVKREAKRLDAERRPQLAEALVKSV